MKPPDRWPLHPAPVEGEALSSWLRRIAASYEMSVTELIEDGLGCDAMADRDLDLDLDPPSALLDVLGQRTGIDRDRLRQTCLAGWVPCLFDSLEAQPGGFETYVRQFSVLLQAGKRSKRSAGERVAWIPNERLRRACPV